MAALEAGLIPVVAPIAVGPLNVNADEAAAALAVGLGAERLLFLTDVDGLILDGEVVDAIGVDAAAELLAGGTLEGGIIPKLGAAVDRRPRRRPGRDRPNGGGRMSQPLRDMSRCQSPHEVQQLCAETVTAAGVGLASPGTMRPARAPCPGRTVSPTA